MQRKQGWGTAGPLTLALASLLALAVALLAADTAWAAFDAGYEARNFSKLQERHDYDYGRPAYQALLAEKGAESEAELLRIRATDPERDFSGNLCAHHMNGCAGDVRFYDWQKDGHGLRRPVLFTARDGATLSGHVWATRDGPSSRPAVVITTGSVQAPEELYGFLAATLARNGYVVLTYDVQGQGRSDTYGEGQDRNHNVPAQQPGPFVEGTEDALDFLLSTKRDPYKPRFPAPGIQQSHRPKQKRRVAAGLDAAYNPLGRLVDPRRIGIVGHSLGAFAVSQVGSEDKRVDAIVALDNLSVGGGSMFGQDTPKIKPRVPALGMSADYGLTPTPYTSQPDPQGKSEASKAYSKKGVDTAQINIRGGSHYEFSFIPNQAFGATLRGMDLVAWYTEAWLDRYVKHGPDGLRELLTTRWLRDGWTAAIDPDGDGNLLSRYYRSRIDIGHRGGPRVHCEDLRSGKRRCRDLTDAGDQGEFSYLRESLGEDDRTRPGRRRAARRRASEHRRSATAPQRHRHARPAPVG